MQPDRVNCRPRAPSRRELLAAAAAFPTARAIAGDEAAGRPAPAGTPRPAEPPWLRTGQLSRVVDVRSEYALHASVVDRRTLTRLVDTGLRALTGRPDSSAAWRHVLGDARRIVVKFNTVGAEALATTEPLAAILLESLLGAGYDRSGIGFVEAPPITCRQLAVRRVIPAGWRGRVAVGGGEDELADYLFECDALINVPFVKTHPIAGMSGCLKNLSHALVRHPARYHGTGCSPYVAQILSSKEITSRLRLNLVNALRTIIDGGPEASPEAIHAHGGLLLGFDPVACDAVALDLIRHQRRARALDSEIHAPHIDSAADYGLGRVRSTEMERIMLEVRV